MWTYVILDWLVFTTYSSNTQATLFFVFLIILGKVDVAYTHNYEDFKLRDC